MKQNYGFTLLELTIWMAIVGLLSTAVVANFKDGGRNDSVRQAARLAESVVRRAQTMTMTGVTEGGSFPTGGYGVHFDSASPNQMILFADADGNFNYDSGEEIAGGIMNFPPRSGLSSGVDLSVVFTPPEGRVYFNGATSPDTETIAFEADGSDLVKSVVIYRVAGMVRVE